MSKQTPKPGDVVHYRMQSGEQVEAVVIDITDDPAYAGSIHGRPPEEGRVHLAFTHPSAAGTAHRLNVPEGTETGHFLRHADTSLHAAAKSPAMPADDGDAMITENEEESQAGMEPHTARARWGKR